MNPYAELELTSAATNEQIKAKYRTLAQIHHPDRGGDEEKFKRIKLAYEILIDPIRRKEYDTTGKIDTDVTVRSEALEQLTIMLLSLLPVINPEHDDLILILKNRTNDMRIAVTNDIAVCNKFIANIQKILKRIKTKGDQENIMSSIAETQLKQRMDELITFNRRIAVCDIMSEILQDYHYSLEEWTLFLGDGAASGNRTRDISLED